MMLERIPLKRTSVPPLASRAPEELRAMRAAGEEILECYRVLRKGGLNVVGEVLRGRGAFLEFNHYPDGDVYDSDSHAQYYYHAHRGPEREHGHFHTFLRTPGMPAGVAPLPYEGREPWPAGKDAISHLIAISMDEYGYPIGLFATNRWVTGETWYAAPDVIRVLERFRIDHANPSWPVNRWIGAMLRLFRPEIEALLRQRDAVVAARAAAHPGADVFEDRGLEITGHLSLNVEERIAAVDRALARREAGSGRSVP